MRRRRLERSREREYRVQRQEGTILQLCAILQYTGERALMDHGIGLARSMSETFSMYCLEVKDDAAEAEAVDKAFQVGLSLSQFLSEAGWFQEAETILFSSKSLLSNSDDDRSVLCSLHCLLRLLRVQNSFALISPAKKSLSESQKLLEIVQERKIDTNLAALYKEIAELYFILSRYDEAYSWSCRSLRELTPSMPPHVVIDAYRQTAKCCMMRRDFSQADLVIEEAVSLALHHYGEKSLKYAGTLVDYGFFLLSMDRVKRSVEIYTKALHIYKEILGGNNLLVALRYEELAYACYVNQYSLGKFFSARSTHVEHALSIFRKLLPPDHLYFSSALRVKALVLEELSLDSQSKTEEGIIPVIIRRTRCKKIKSKIAGCLITGYSCPLPLPNCSVGDSPRAASTLSAFSTVQDRLIVVRDPDGTLRRATGDERERMNQNYFPNPFKKHYLPHMFHGSYFKDLMDRREYEFVLERACHQFDPDHPGFIEVSRTVYDTIDDKGEHLILKHTRHFGALMFHLCWVNRIDNALVLFLRIGSVQDAVDLVRLFYELQPSKSPSVDYEENPLGFLEEFVEAHAFQRDLLKELVNVIRNQVTEERETG
ncbi:unnamed protein product [Cyprideis torosa]|uniref:Uncharacterized protein n=1 Tax=Cyprideis torosa TaxID=163714 RepID=A0A7R8ZMK4_9CRUS|nr:unnamed protein product [Cyprideis torosa]CAG0894434.1 unnamed protein product [Cyprideis torosa]